MAAWLLNLDTAVYAGTASPDELASADAVTDPPQADVSATASPLEVAALATTTDAPQADVSVAASPLEVAALTVATDPPQADVTAAASPDELTSADAVVDPPSAGMLLDPVFPDGIPAAVAVDPPTADWAATATPDGLAVSALQDQAAAVMVLDPALPDELFADVVVDPPTAAWTVDSQPDAGAADVTPGTPGISIDDTAATPDGVAVPTAGDNPAAGEIDYTQPADDINPAVAVDPAAVSFSMAALPTDQPVTVALDTPTGSFGAATTPDGQAADTTVGDGPAVGALVGPDGLQAGTAGDNPTAAFTATVAAGAGPTVAVTQDSPIVLVSFFATPDPIAATVGSDPATLLMQHFVVPPDTFTVPISLTAPTFTFAPSDTTAAPSSLHVPLTPGTPTNTTPALPAAPPIAPTPAYAPPALPVHLLGIGPWNSTVVWRGAPNHGVKAGQWARIDSTPTGDGDFPMGSVPILALPMADSKKVTLRLNAAGEATTSHYFSRREAIVIDENITDLWWRRRDPRRGVIDRLGRYNAANVDIDVQSDGGVNVSASFVDYFGLLSERIILQYLTPAADPPTTEWLANTLVTDILRWAIPTNLGLDLTGIQAASPDITAKIKSPYHLPLGTSIADMMEGLLSISDKQWEWWVEMPASDIDRPRLTLATARGSDRGVTLFDLGGQGPIEKWSLQKSDKYANTILFVGANGGVVKSYPDQVAIYGQRDVFVTDTSVSDVTATGVVTTTRLNAAADKKLAELAANTPSLQITLRSGFWEGRTHIDVGDWVGTTFELGDDVLIGKYRVSELQLEVDSNGYETVTLTLGTPRPSRDPRSRSSSTAKLVRYLRNYETLPNATTV